MSNVPINNGQRPQPQPRGISAPVLHNHGPSLGKFIVVGFASTFINGSVIAVLIVLSFLLGLNVQAAEKPEEPEIEQQTEVEDTPREYDLTNTDLGMDDSVPLNYNVDRIEEVSVPGKVDPTQSVGLENAPVQAPTNVPAPAGTGGGTGGAPFDPNVSGTGSTFGSIGGMGGPGGGGFAGRSGATRVKMVQEGGGNAKSEKAVADGLRWLALHQSSDGSWSMDKFNRNARTAPIGDSKGRVIPDNSSDPSHNNDTAGTAFGLLPFLAAGITHKPPVKWKGYLKKEYVSGEHKVAEGTEVEVLADVGSDYKVRIKLTKGEAAKTTDVVLTDDAVFVQPNYNKTVAAGVRWLINKQTKTGKPNEKGEYGGGMYSHGIATIAMCEAYGLTSDPLLKASAQMGLDYIMAAQHSGGGWRYGFQTAGDTSVVGWMVMALKSGQMAGLSVKKESLKRVEAFLRSVQPPNEDKDPQGSYGYVGYQNPTPAMTAVGALCRQYMGTNPRNPSLLKSVGRIKAMPPGKGGGLYYEYYATQVMHHMGSETWDFWNLGPDGKNGIRDTLIAKQDQNGANKGSWKGDGHVHGRIEATSLSLLTLEVYYRHLPLYRRDAGMAKPDDK